MLTRREMLKSSLTAGGVVLVGFHETSLSAALQEPGRDAFRGGRYLGLVEFVREGPIPMGIPMGAGLDGRLYTDLSEVGRDKATIPNDKFYLRTRASEFLGDGEPW